MVEGRECAKMPIVYDFGKQIQPHHVGGYTFQF